MKKMLLVLIFVSFSTMLLAEPSSNSIAYSVARGGKLYDKWFKANSAPRPETANPAYPDTGKYKGNKAADWRCKECHGWDYLGKDGIYGTGKHFTGIAGLQNATTIYPAQLAGILQDKNHGYTETMLSRDDVTDLANFLRLGTFDMSRYIDRKTMAVSGNITSGQNYYETICAGCHDLDGKGEETPPLGELSNENPWETLHKILNGQPGQEMPALMALNTQVAVDILAYLQTLPKK